MVMAPKTERDAVARVIAATVLNFDDVVDVDATVRIQATEARVPELGDTGFVCTPNRRLVPVWWSRNVDVRHVLKEVQSVAAFVHLSPEFRKDAPFVGKDRDRRDGLHHLISTSAGKSCASVVVTVARSR